MFKKMPNIPAPLVVIIALIPVIVIIAIIYTTMHNTVHYDKAHRATVTSYHVQNTDNGTRVKVKLSDGKILRSSTNITDDNPSEFNNNTYGDLLTDKQKNINKGAIIKYQKVTITHPITRAKDETLYNVVSIENQEG